MSIIHHNLDPNPIPKDNTPLYVNGPWLVDDSILYGQVFNREPENEPDNVRIYVPIDLNRKAILRRLRMIIARYEEANEDNEFEFSMEVE